MKNYLSKKFIAVVKGETRLPKGGCKQKRLYINLPREATKVAPNEALNCIN